MADLFAAAAEERLRSTAPLAARLRPRTIDDVVGQEHLVGPGRPLRRLVEQDRLTSAIFWGPPGTGKTTLALAVAGTTARAFEQMSAVTAGVKDVREAIERARHRLGERGQGTILFLDEIHRFSKSQQDALLPGRRGRHADADRRHHREPVLRGQPAAAQPLHAVPPRAARRRGDAHARRARAAGRGRDGRATTRSTCSSTASGGDGRQVLTSLEVACALALPGPCRARARRGGARHERPALRARRPLRRDQRLHQVDARLRPGRRRVLAGADARGGRGRPLHRPADGDLRQRGRRHGRPAGAAGGGRRRPCRRARRAARGPAQPVAGGDPPGHGAQEQPFGAGDLERPRGGARRRRRRGSGAPARRALPGCRRDRSRRRLRVPS